jgi:putative transposase
MSTTKFITTYQFRIKDSNKALRKALMVLSGKVNFVWNYINDLQQKKVKNKDSWLSAFDLQDYTKGTSKLLNLPAQTIQAIQEEYVTRRVQFKKPWLKFRTNRKNRNLPWIPIKAQDLKIVDKTTGVFGFNGLKLKTWYSDYIPSHAKITNASIVKDNLGHWFINITVKYELTDNEMLALTSAGQNTTSSDHGLNPMMTLCIEEPDGSKTYKEIEPPKYYREAEENLGKQQRARRFNQARKTHKKIKNQRKDFTNKLVHELVMDNKDIVIGIVDLKKLVKSSLKGHSKAWHDNALGSFNSKLKTKAQKHSVGYHEVEEKVVKSTQTCSNCNSVTGPKGLKGLRVSKWQCFKCGFEHIRNRNSALNHMLAWKSGIV